MVKAIVLTGAGINCERESAGVLEAAGFDAEIVHIIDLLESPNALNDAQMLFFPGGFSYGDHAGAAMVLAEQMRRLNDQLQEFITRDTLVMGVCNGCQLLLRLNMIGDGDWGFRANAGGHYECRWIEVTAARDSAFFKKGDVIPMPVAHGEGQLFGGSDAAIGLQYSVNGKCANGVYPANPNGAQSDAAGVLAHDGRVLAMMPHPERGFFNWQRPDAARAKEIARRKGEAFDMNGFTPAANLFTSAYDWLK